MANPKKAGSAPVQAAAWPSAVVLPLPTAAAAPVEQQRRPGRYPRSITSLSTERATRSAPAQALRLVAQLELVRKVRRENWAEVLRAKEAVHALERQIAEASAAYAAMAREDQALCAELSALGYAVPTYAEHLSMAPQSRAPEVRA